jgi:hypothetical protein
MDDRLRFRADEGVEAAGRDVTGITSHGLESGT